MTFERGGTTLPLTASTANSLADDCDKPVTAMLSFLKAVLEADLQDRFRAELTKCGYQMPGNPDGYIVSELMPIPILSRYILEGHVTFPVLSVSGGKEQYFEKTQNRKANTREITLQYLFPAGMTLHQAVSLEPLLHKVTASIRNALENGRHRNVNAGASWMTGTGIDILTIIETDPEHKSPGRDSELLFPSLVMRIEIEEHDEQSPTDYVPLAAIDGYVSSVVADEDPFLIAQTLNNFS